MQITIQERIAKLREQKDVSDVLSGWPIAKLDDCLNPCYDWFNNWTKIHGPTLKKLGDESSADDLRFLLFHGFVFYLRILMPMADVLDYVKKHNPNVEYVNDYYFDIYSQIDSSMPLSTHEIFSYLRKSCANGDDTMCRNLANSFSDIGIIDAVFSDDEHHFSEILASDSITAAWYGKLLSIIVMKDGFSEQRKLLEDLERTDEISFVEYNEILDEILEEEREAIPYEYYLYKARGCCLGKVLRFLTELDQEATKTMVSRYESEHFELVPYEIVLHDFRFRMYDYLNNKDQMSEEEIAEIKKALNNPICYLEYERALKDYESGELEKAVLEEVAYYEKLVDNSAPSIGCDVRVTNSGIVITTTSNNFKMEIKGPDALVESKGFVASENECSIEGLAEAGMGDSENMEELVLNWPKELFGKDAKLWDNVPLSINNNKERVKRIYSVLTKYRYIDNTQNNLDLLVCFLTKRKAKGVIEPIVWNSKKEDLCFFIKKMAECDSRKWKKSERLFVYCDGKCFVSLGAGKCSESTSVNKDFIKDLEVVLDDW